MTGGRLKPAPDPSAQKEALEYDRNRRLEKTPTGHNLLGPFSVVCLVLNRTIGKCCRYV
jgi:hypothetical protein